METKDSFTPQRQSSDVKAQRDGHVGGAGGAGGAAGAAGAGGAQLVGAKQLVGAQLLLGGPVVGVVTAKMLIDKVKKDSKTPKS